jgi:hypothetical protein
MTSIVKRALISIGLAAIVAGAALGIAAGARADSTPVGALPPGQVSVVKTGPSQLVAVALPHARKRSGLVWRIARRYDSSVVRQVSEADIGSNVVLVFKVVGRGDTSLVFALTRGDRSGKATKAVTHKIHSR